MKLKFLIHKKTEVLKNRNCGVTAAIIRAKQYKKKYLGIKDNTVNTRQIIYLFFNRRNIKYLKQSFNFNPPHH